ncbi:MAG: hypothetical protein ABIZ30_02070 [Candidatus Limnocylindrales bacterium]
MAVNADGSDVRELATGVGALSLDWSPDGSALLASELDRDEWKQTHVVRSDGSGFRTLNFGPTFFVISAASRPDGRHIAIRGEQEVGTPDNDIHAKGLYLADADGTNLRQLPIGPVAGVSGLEWSPDWRHLSFASNGPGGIVQVSIADIDENGELTALRRLRLDPESSSEMWPKWSPDGSQLAVLTTKGSREQIAVVDPDGSGFRIVWPDVTGLWGQTDTSGRLMDGRWSSRRSSVGRIRTAGRSSAVRRGRGSWTWQPASRPRSRRLSKAGSDWHHSWPHTQPIEKPG